MPWRLEGPTPARCQYVGDDLIPVEGQIAEFESEDQARRRKAAKAKLCGRCCGGPRGGARRAELTAAAGDAARDTSIDMIAFGFQRFASTGS